MWSEINLLKFAASYFMFLPQHPLPPWTLQVWAVQMSIMDLRTCMQILGLPSLAPPSFPSHWGSPSTPDCPSASPGHPSHPPGSQTKPFPRVRTLPGNAAHIHSHPAPSGGWVLQYFAQSLCTCSHRTRHLGPSLTMCPLTVHSHTHPVTWLH